MTAFLFDVDAARRFRWLSLTLCVAILAAVLATVAGERAAADSRPVARHLVEDPQDDARDGWLARSSQELRGGLKLLRLQDEWESRLTTKANAALAPAFRDSVTVTVSVELDPRSEFKSGVNMPAKGLQPNLIETVRDGVSDRGSVDAGHRALAADPHLAPAVSVDGVRGGRQSGRRGGDIERKQTDPTLYGRKTETLLAPPIRRITASIVIDEAVLANYEDALEAKSAVLEIVKHAIGYDESRGDLVNEPAVVKFSAAQHAAASNGTDWMMFVVLLLAASGVTVFVLMSIGWFRSRRSPLPVAAVEPGDEPRNLGPEELAQRMREEIERAIENDPNAVNRWLDDWLMERKA